MSDNEREDTALLTPGAAAARLGISGAALRRMAVSYERVYGDLPEGAAGRLWPTEAVDRLHEARALMNANRARSIQGGLEALKAGAQVSVEAPVASGRDLRTLEIIAERLEAVERLEREVAALRAEIQSKPTALPSTMPHSRPVAFGAGTAPESEPAPSTEARAGFEAVQDGVIVRLARRLERILGRG